MLNNLLEQQDSLSSWIKASNEYALHKVSGSLLYHMHLETSPNRIDGKYYLFQVTDKWTRFIVSINGDI